MLIISTFQKASVLWGIECALLNACAYVHLSVCMCVCVHSRVCVCIHINALCMSAVPVPAKFILANSK